jgi:hypothetical protein
MRRDRLQHLVQPVYPAIDEIRQRARRVQHAEQDVCVGAPHVQVGEDDAFPLFRQSTWIN